MITGFGPESLLWRAALDHAEDQARADESSLADGIAERLATILIGG